MTQRGGLEQKLRAKYSRPLLLRLAIMTGCGGLQGNAGDKASIIHNGFSARQCRQ